MGNITTTVGYLGPNPEPASARGTNILGLPMLTQHQSPPPRGGNAATVAGKCMSCQQCASEDVTGWLERWDWWWLPLPDLNFCVRPRVLTRRPSFVQAKWPAQTLGDTLGALGHYSWGRRWMSPSSEELLVSACQLRIGRPVSCACFGIDILCTGPDFLGNL